MELLHYLSLLTTLLLSGLIAYFFTKSSSKIFGNNYSSYFIKVFWLIIILLPSVDNMLYKHYKLNTAFAYVNIFVLGIPMVFITFLYLISDNKKPPIHKQDIPPQKPTD